jgi:hypothetical protein
MNALRLHTSGSICIHGSQSNLGQGRRTAIAFMIVTVPLGRDLLTALLDYRMKLLGDELIARILKTCKLDDLLVVERQAEASHILDV